MLWGNLGLRDHEYYHPCTGLTAYKQFFNQWKLKHKDLARHTRKSMTILKGLDDREVGHSRALPRPPPLSTLGPVGDHEVSRQPLPVVQPTCPLLVCVTGGWGLGRLLDLDHRVLVVLDLRHGVQNFLAREEH